MSTVVVPTSPARAAAPAPRILHRGDVTLRVLHVGPDYVRLSVTRPPAGSHRSAADRGAPDPAEAAAPAAVDPHVRAVLNACAGARGSLLDALRSCLGDDVAGMSVDRDGAALVVTLDLLPTRRPRRRAACPVG